MSDTIDIVFKIVEAAPGMWFVRTEGLPDGDHSMGPYPDEEAARVMQQSLADLVAAQLGGPAPIVGNPNRS